MKIAIYDVEVFKYNWLVVIKDKESGERQIVWDDADALEAALDNDNYVYIGFNSKAYDQFIVKGILYGLKQTELKRLSDDLVKGHNGWEHPLMKNQPYLAFNNVDIRDDMYMALSLKAIEGHLGLPIRESSVDFNIDRPLTDEEKAETEKYCCWDVDTTEKVVDLRKGYLKTKLNLGKRAGIPEVKALGSTNAKLTALMLRARRREWTDGRDYVYPPNLDLSVIPNEILNFFETIHDMSIPDEDLFKTSLEITLGGMPCKYAWGGVHGSVSGYYEEETETRVIRNKDVSSLYPSLIELYKYLSRNVPDPQLFYAIRRDRIEAKHKGDKQLANDLKLPLNTVSGAQEAKFNDLYDPLPTRSMRISGQLFLTVLTIRLLNACQTIKLLNLNTDGLAYSIDKSEEALADMIASEWEKETGFELETDYIQKVWIKDVNNLLIVKSDGYVKKVGGYLEYGISQKGAWKINNSLIAVKKAVLDHFTTGISVRDAINSYTDIFDFQIVAKAGAKYKEAYWLVDGFRIQVQKVNRVYATKDERYGRLYKVKASNDSTAKIEMLPEHCIIDNENRLSIEDIDKEFYIQLAEQRVKDFLGQGKRGTKRVATETKTKMNVYQKLIKARAMFLAKKVTKSGKNMNLEFTYFELADIVPAAIEIFSEVGLVSVPWITPDEAVLTIIDTDAPDQSVIFRLPFTPIEPIITNSGKKATNEMQALGASITYIRRYLYMIALDIVEPDTIDSSAGLPEEKPKKQTAPVTAEKREEIKKELTDGEAKATALQIRALKGAMKKLLAANPEKQEDVNKIVLATDNFKNVTKSQCEGLIKKIAGMVEEQKEEGTDNGSNSKED